MTAFVDTNVIVYAQEAGPKGVRARELLAAGGLISVQVLNELVNVLTRKLGRPWHEVRQVLRDTLDVFPEPLPLTLAIHVRAFDLTVTEQISFYDALIVSAAIESNCTTLLTEDIQDGRVFGELRVANPFK